MLDGQGGQVRIRHAITCCANRVEQVPQHRQVPVRGMHGGRAWLGELLLNIFDGAINGERRIHDSARVVSRTKPIKVYHGKATVSAPDMIYSNQERARACWAVASLVAKTSRLMSSSFTCRARAYGGSPRLPQSASNRLIFVMSTPGRISAANGLTR